MTKKKSHVGVKKASTKVLALGSGQERVNAKVLQTLKIETIEERRRNMHRP